VALDGAEGVQVGATDADCRPESLVPQPGPAAAAKIYGSPQHVGVDPQVSSGLVYFQAAGPQLITRPLAPETVLPFRLRFYLGRREFPAIGARLFRLAGLSFVLHTILHRYPKKKSINKMNIDSYSHDNEYVVANNRAVFVFIGVN